jgi:hypothetical protein
VRESRLPTPDPGASAPESTYQAGDGCRASRLHAGVAAYGLFSDYDQPISSPRWQSVS